MYGKLEKLEWENHVQIYTTFAENRPRLHFRVSFLANISLGTPMKEGGCPSIPSLNGVHALL